MSQTPIIDIPGAVQAGRRIEKEHIPNIKKALDEYYRNPTPENDELIGVEIKKYYGDNNVKYSGGIGENNSLFINLLTFGNVNRIGQEQALSGNSPVWHKEGRIIVPNYQPPKQ